VKVVGYLYDQDFWCITCLRHDGVDPSDDEVSPIYDTFECDYPRHCGGCREFLEGPLTADGEESLKTNYRDGSYRVADGSPDETFQEYMDSYWWINWHFLWTFVGLMDPYGDVED
jgi:hypothetical protein